MEQFEDGQTILNYIKHNTITIRLQSLEIGQLELARWLTNNNPLNETIGQSKLSHIIQYLGKKPIEYKAKDLTDFVEGQTILSFIKTNPQLVLASIRLSGQTAIAKLLTNSNLACDKISQPKLNHIVQFIREELDQ
jgi:hypothetical protein